MLHVFQIKNTSICKNKFTNLIIIDYKFQFPLKLFSCEFSVFTSLWPCAFSIKYV